MQNVIEIVIQIYEKIGEIVWSIPMLILIFGTGLYFTIRTGFIQFRKFGYIIKKTIGSAFGKGHIDENGAVSPFQAVTTALAGTVGTGNIAGVAGAISLGGPGAVFWMWVSALVGMLTKYSEIMLAVKYRERNQNGDWVGGPMYYITNGLGKNFRWLAVCFSLIGILASIGAGNMIQVNTIAGASISLINEFFSKDIIMGGKAEILIRLAVGLIVAYTSALVLLGGVKRIGIVSEKLVPSMSLVYITCTLTVVITNFGHIGDALKSIFIGAFSPDAVIGGAFGISIMQSLKRGIGRGVFSNEAGLGSTSMAHAATVETDPVKQGLFGIFEVFIDTIVICTLTALTILVSEVYVPYGQNAGAELTITALSTTFGGKAAGTIITSCIALFAMSSILSWALYGSRCAEFIFGPKILTPYKAIFIVFIIIGASLNISIAWGIADTLNGLMAFPNLVALLGLSGVVIKETNSHFNKH